MIMRAQSPSDLRGLLTFESADTSHAYASYTEWVQWLMQQVGRNDKLAVWIVREEGVFLGYAVLVDAVAPPLFRSVVLLHWNPPDEQVGKELMGAIAKWAGECGAECIEAPSKTPKQLMRLGFMDSGTVLMMKEL